ncbi:uncharacterized protein LOC136075131 [Hydra vulgaris]|uniref:Uncharacterized protein LOC136075131 n=1 Tax=Hydra vulgaris TaxID=6087 RepID=A0ABM4B3X6_HYDVU
MDAVLRDATFQIKLSELLNQDWFKIGAFLKVEQTKLIEIRDDYIIFRRQENKAHEMIQEWFKVKNATFEDLKLAIDSIPNYNLLKKVEELAYTFLNKSLSSQNNITNQPNDTSGKNFEPKSGWFVKMLSDGAPNPGNS